MTKANTVRVVFCGTAGFHPNKERDTACVMIPELGVVFDAGTGFWRVRDLLRTRDLHVFFSHYHHDHAVGLTYLADVAWQKKLQTLHIYGKSPIEAVDGLFAEPYFPKRLDDHGLVVERHEWSPQQRGWKIGNAVVKARAMPHTSGGSLGYVLTWRGKKIAYLTDTIVAQDMADFVREVDVLICECNFPNAMRARALRTYHSYPRIVGEFARNSRVKQLILIHIAPLLENPNILRDEVAKIFPRVTVARDGQSFILK